MKNLARLAAVTPPGAEKDYLRRLGDGWQVEMRPAALLQEVPDEIVEALGSGKRPPVTATCTSVTTTTAAATKPNPIRA